MIMKVLFTMFMYFMFLLLFNNKDMKIKKISVQILLLLMMKMMIILMKMNLFCWIMIYMNMGVDYLSWWLIMLTFWIFFLVLMYFNKILLVKLMLYILLMIIILYLVFIYMNMFMFYLMFEISLIPILLMILGWGTMEDRITASFYMLMYTLFSSMPLLILIFYVFNMNYTLVYMYLEKSLLINFSLIMYLMSFLGFFVKMPSYLFHLWLPKAHVEAPVYGSMILAAILLKLGSYGLYRFMVIMDKISLNYNYIFISLSLVGMLNMSLVCLMQIDMKIIVAYSSVVHMGILMGGILTLKELGIYGSLFMMVAHGLCSSGMFSMVNMFYDRTQSRNLLINKGLLVIMPLLMMGWFLLCSSNLAAPPSLNLVGEILLISSLLSWNYLIILVLMMVSFFSAMYSIYLFSIVSHGKLNYNLMLFNSGMLMEYYLIFLHWIPLNFLILNLLN